MTPQRPVCIFYFERIWLSAAHRSGKMSSTSLGLNVTELSCYLFEYDINV